MAEFEFDEPQHIRFAACLGGTGDDCAGGTRVYQSEAPGFEHVEEDDEDVFVLLDDITVSLEVVAIDSAMRLSVEGILLDEPGEAAVLQTTPGAPGVHAHVEFSLAIPGGSPTNIEKRVTLRLTTTSSTYQSSDPFTLIFTPDDGDEE